jgi:hypothetical protein
MIRFFTSPAIYWYAYVNDTDGNACVVYVRYGNMVYFFLCKNVVLDFVHRLYFNKITFRTWSPGLRLAQPGGAQQLGFLSFLFYLKKEEDPASETL